MVAIRSHVQAFALGAKVTLYKLDLTAFGLGIIRLVAGVKGSTIISFGGNAYSPHPLKTEGWELSANNSLPRPTFTVANVDNAFTALVEQGDDLHGAILSRIRTYERYLDGGVEPDGNATLPIDVYQLVQKTEHTQDQISWVCAALMDQEDVVLPGRIITRDYCTHDVRRWTGSAFDYTNATCPYTGAAKDINGVACASADEVFSKRLSTCCKARFGATAVLPTRAFPGVARLRLR